ncbi:hypothetical protein SR882_10175 [Guyparkeria halophila]|uniref:Uncharacterized protein n=1 Tax=Guyparkeria halophila TaxID=47960 RepID=A0ABZ0YVQ3_9GAMM|nr:hypothetical protein [Guyparkeria halophila]WQH16116.1 hypothetical protein SR882_10175 [Guyparkeria halophila]
MKSSEVVEIFKGAIESTKQNGIDKVSIEDLEAYTARLEEAVNESPEGVHAGEANMEKYRADLNAWITARQHQYEYNLEMLRSVITVGQSALKSALLINGGAAVAVLAFIGRLFSSESASLSMGGLSLALLQFVWGVLGAAIAAGATYFSQAGYGGEFGSWSRGVGVGGHIVAVLGVFSAYGCFGVGAWQAYSAINLG